MDPIGLIDNLNKALVREKLDDAELSATPAAAKLMETRMTLGEIVRDAGKSGDLDVIVAVERRLLENDLAQYANSGAMAKSLEAALVELTATEKMMPIIKNPSLYAVVDQSHGHPKTRNGGLPLDAARKFFKSHSARLLNQDKSRLDAEEKRILDVRKQNMRTAGKLYAAMQEQTLGAAPTRVRENDMGMEL